MARIFLALALFAVALLLANLVVALTIGDFGVALQGYENARDAWRTVDESPDASAADWQAERERFSQATTVLNKQRKTFWPHVWLGIVATLVCLLVNCISVTYFIGTSRWCREVTEAYAMDPDLAEQSQALKRRTFPWALASIVMILSILVLGGASDVYSPAVERPSAFVHWHMLAAMVGIVVIATSFLVQVNAVAANYDLIHQIVAAAKRMRDETPAGHRRVESQESRVKSQRGEGRRKRAGG